MEWLVNQFINSQYSLGQTQNKDLVPHLFRHRLRHRRSSWSFVFCRGSPAPVFGTRSETNQRSLFAWCTFTDVKQGDRK